MNVKDYEYIAALGKYRTISRASQELYISQPALSKFLQKTEQELNVCLFQRVGHQLVPTYAGQQLIQNANEILYLHNGMLRTMADVAQQRSGQIKIGVPMSRGIFFIARVLPRFYQRYPGVCVNVHEDNTQTLLKKLRLGELDLVFAHIPENSSDLHTEVVSTEEMVLAAPAAYHLENSAYDDPRFRFPCLAPDAWIDHPFLMLSKDQLSRKFTDQYLEERQLVPHVILKLRNLAQVLYAVGCGIGVTLCPALPFADDMPNRLRYFSLQSGTGPASRKVAILYRTDAYLSKAEQDLISIIRACMNDESA
ncbi:LysR family transcriptional regulator [Angelakisella massiliensis]|uniref:LysR family transcriptional regulator n=1 Tax=Angelakisella massiliensis TaxID=1871018 RepID=UPI0023A8D245|nr:LysR family transcriptional regulator [Angelakisella massiliensis]